MSGEVTGKKLSDLRVTDLKLELEKRGLETSGIKCTLLERLQKALSDEGISPEEFVFDSMKATPKPQRVARTNGDDNAKDDDDDEQTDDVTAKTEIKKEETNGTQDEETGDNDTTSCDKLLDSNIDNEDSLNLTIGEDEAKIFQDEDMDEKPKEENSNDENLEKCDENEVNSSANTTISSGGDNGAGKTNDTNGQQNNDDGSVAGDDATDDQKDSSASARKNDDSDTKTSTSKSFKDDKDSPSKSGSTTSKTSTGAKAGGTTSTSRNLWVSGLSNLTRATDLKIIFSKYGKVIGCKVVTNTRTPGSRCYGYVTMNSSSDSAKCIGHLHRTELHGRIISVERAKLDMSGAIAKSKTDGVKKKFTGDGKSSDRKKSSSSSSNGTSNKESSESAKKTTTKSKEPEKPATDGEEVKTPSDGTAKPKVAVKTDSDSSSHKRKSVTGASATERRGRVVRERRDTDRTARRTDREVLSFQRIREERERHRMRERERKLREEERRRDEFRRRQREEEDRLERERLRLKKERIRLEREKADLLKLERERQKLEREKIELEKLELKRQQLKFEETKRAIKRSAQTTSDTDRYGDIDRKRPTTERRFEPPPPPRFDTAIRSSTYDRQSTEKKRIDDYSSSSSKRNNDDYKSSSSRGPGLASEISSFKRPINDYPKRDHDTSSRSGGYEQRGISSITSSSKDHRFNDSVDSRGTSFGRNRSNDDRDTRPSLSSNKSRYLDSSGGNNTSSDRYTDRNSSSNNSWNNPNSGPSSSLGKSFGSLQSATTDPWGSLKPQQPQESNSWNRSIEHQSQDRYDRTYNERKSSSQYLDGPLGNTGGSRPNTFLGNQRPQDRYSNNNLSSRFDNSRF